MPQLSLKVEPTAGTHINDAFEEASELARFLNLAWVAFDFNGESCTAYADHRGFAMDAGAHTVGYWTSATGFVRKDGA
jgi:hypothetical protein